MKRIVTKHSYKVGLCAMALALLMSTAGGVTAGAQDYSVKSSGELKPMSEGVFMIFDSSSNFINEGIMVKSISSQNTNPKNLNGSWYWKFWDKVKLFFKRFREGFGIQRLFGFK
ncbi:TPA: hypothetical protein TZS81_001414 [Streptococcus suis]|nr:hypothetical protein [Streptococcus suis]HEL2396299.1 hypothetical protein [Streptococcus suis]HEL9618070.1 hypothetical protein [Streptococcus suis]HEL9649246.1 hypothetical protein [Streptococcus suis]